MEAVKGVQALREAIKAGEYGRVQQIYPEIDVRETEADELGRRLSESLSQGSFFSHLREDLLSLIEEIDDIADSAKDAVKTLMEVEPDWNLVRFLFEQPEMDEYVELCVEIVEKLAEAVKVLKVGGLTAP